MTQRKLISFERKVFLLALSAGLPGGLVALILVWVGDYSLKSVWSLSLLVILPWLGMALAVRQKVRFPLQTLSNLLAGIREGDFSTRARGARRDDALGEVIAEVNLLGNTLREQRLEAVEASALVRTILDEIDLAVFAFDDDDQLKLVNPAGEQLLARPAVQLLGRRADALGLDALLSDTSHRTVEMAFPSRMGRWEVRRTPFRQDGVPHQLLVLSDLSRTLREEERLAWQRLVRVLGHEINNSLAPIISIAASLNRMVPDFAAQGVETADLQTGLQVVGSRAESLSRFMEAYARLARLPPPERRPLSVGSWLQKVIGLDLGVPIRLEAGPDVTLSADPDQLEQVLINLLRNAAEAMSNEKRDSEADGIRVRWEVKDAWVRIEVIDTGVGLANTTNLFVPFFTTKPKGSGIGLVLSRQIAEAHGGHLFLTNRTDASGCVAVLELERTEGESASLACGPPQRNSGSD